MDRVTQTTPSKGLFVIPRLALYIAYLHTKLTTLDSAVQWHFAGIRWLLPASVAECGNSLRWIVRWRHSVRHYQVFGFH